MRWVCQALDWDLRTSLWVENHCNDAAHGHDCWNSAICSSDGMRLTGLVSRWATAAVSKAATTVRPIDLTLFKPLCNRIGHLNLQNKSQAIVPLYSILNGAAVGIVHLRYLFECFLISITYPDCTLAELISGFSNVVVLYVRTRFNPKSALCVVAGQNPI